MNYQYLTINYNWYYLEIERFQNNSNLEAGQLPQQGALKSNYKHMITFE